MSTATAPQKMQLIKRELPLLSSSDDHLVLKQVLATHIPNGRVIKAAPLLLIVEDILNRARPTVLLTPPIHLDSGDDKTHNRPGVAGSLEALAYTINKISAEIEFRCSRGGSDHAHDTTLYVLELLSAYGWDAKVVLILAAFATSYGEFWLVMQLHILNPLAKSLAILKQIPDVFEHRDVLEPRLEALSRLARAMLDVAKRIMEFNDLPLEYISLETWSMATAHIPIAVYWIIRSAVVCSSQISGLIGLGHEYISSTTEAWEMSNLAHKIGSIHGHLTKQLALCHQHIVDKRNAEAYNALVRVFETDHADNTKVLRELVSSQDDLPLVNGLTMRRESLDVLRRRVVLLLISDLDVSHDEELLVLVQIYANQSVAERQYEILWLPLVDRHAACLPGKDEIFDRVVSDMPWYSLRHPWVLAPAAVKYVRDVWGFEKKPVLVALDAEGKVVCRNAMNMMWIWGSLAFPFTGRREEALWREETWRIELLVDSIDPAILEWVKEGRHVCLYGGEDVAWIRRFTALLRRVSKETGVPVETVHVGKRNPNERSRKATAAIASEGLSGYWSDCTMVWFFWTRLESMWYSKMQHGMTCADDPVMRQVTSLLSYDGGDEGWAAVGRAGEDIVASNGKRLVDCLTQFDVWKEDVAQRGLAPTLRSALAPLETPAHCTRLVLPEEAEKIEEQVVCAECGRGMEKLVLYRCCSD